MLVILGLPEIALAREQADDFTGTVDVLAKGVAEIPFAPIAVLDSAADRRDAGGLQLFAGGQELVPGRRRLVRVKALSERSLL